MPSREANIWQLVLDDIIWFYDGIISVSFFHEMQEISILWLVFYDWVRKTHRGLSDHEWSLKCPLEINDLFGQIWESLDHSEIIAILRC